MVQATVADVRKKTAIDAAIYIYIYVCVCVASALVLYLFMLMDTM